MDLLDSLLGKKTNYIDNYDPSLLFRIPRINNRKVLGLNSDDLPFYGTDIWNCYEISWLNERNKPCVAIGTFHIPYDSLNIIESKSLKLYLNSFNNSIVSSILELETIILKDLQNTTNSLVTCKLSPLNEYVKFGEVSGTNIDHLDIECPIYSYPDNSLIEYENEIIEEEINSNLLKSNCLVTGQPDWGTIVVKYCGKKIKHNSLLKYFISFRNHNEFAEQCAERIFTDIKNAINPTYLSVYIRYTRRGGIDICPYRTTDIFYELPNNDRLIRQ